MPKKGGEEQRTGNPSVAGHSHSHSQDDEGHESKDVETTDDDDDCPHPPVLAHILHRPVARATLYLYMIMWRTMTGFHPHSGQDNHHNNNDGVAYGGDFEAQRHWMELTTHLPLSQWYVYDLQYWGLDYPPLTAYVSWICGNISHFAVGPHSVAFESSRGLEDETAKAFMRFTVLVLDILVYFPPVIAISKRLSATISNNKYNSDNSSTRHDLIWIHVWTVIFALSQPSILLIDHGHFQYNTVSLGLALSSFYFMTKSSTEFYANSIFGSILFCLALNFKQMTLYYAPAVFSYLLGRCFATTAGASQMVPWSQALRRIATLGVAVILTFALLWLPFYLNPPMNDEFGIEGNGVRYLKHIVHRLFPFERGLFENKVSNLWCALSTKPLSIRRRIPSHWQPMVATLVTLLLILPPCLSLFCIGRQKVPSQTQTQTRRKEKTPTMIMSRQHLRAILWGTTTTSLAFFLASFQVHEKSILMAVAPLSLLILDGATSTPLQDGSKRKYGSTSVTMQAPCFAFVSFFSILASWSMWPLMQVDNLYIAYPVCNLLFLLLVYMYSKLHWEVTGSEGDPLAGSSGDASPTYIQQHAQVEQQRQQQQHYLNVAAAEVSIPYSSTEFQNTNKSDGTSRQFKAERWTRFITEWIEYLTKVLVIPLAALTMTGLHVSQAMVFSPPPHLPDVYPVLWSIVGCALFCWSWLYCAFQCDVLRYANRELRLGNDGGSKAKVE
jgi:alpha-1,3-glucosyltransferase